MINNIDPEREDVLSVVGDINDMYQDIQYTNAEVPEYILPCIYEEANGVYHIKLLGVILWDSDNDDRPYVDSDEIVCEVKQDLKEYIHQELKYIVHGLNLLINYKVEEE